MMIGYFITQFDIPRPFIIKLLSPIIVSFYKTRLPWQLHNYRRIYFYNADAFFNLHCEKFISSIGNWIKHK